jgi:predicted  nucleic acid-binding Zn-ribbon protein
MGRPFEHRSLLHHRYYSREETLEELKEYMGELEKELQWVRERITELEKKK